MHLAVSNLCEPRRGVCLSAPRVHKLEPVSDSEAALGFRVIALNWGNPLKPQTPYATRRSNAVYRGRGRFLPPTGWARSSLTHGLRFLALAVAYVVASPHPVLAAADWVLVCPEGGPGEPHFRDQRGRALPILIPGERAIAEKLCNLSLPVSAVNVNVSVTNSGANTIYLAFTDYSTQLPGPITWTTCTVVNNQVVIPGASATPNNTCSALVPATAGKTRFCAFTSQVPVGQTPNCNLAQTYNQTMIETNFGTGSNGVCYPASLSSCVWYDISVIPQNCTPAAWTTNNCANTGGASYNLPVALSSPGQLTYTCQGPPSNTYGNANYPSNCGIPTASCVGNLAACDNAYFWPTPSPAPNSEAQPGQTLYITFLAGS